MSAFIRAKLAPLRLALVIRPVPVPVLVLFIPTAPAA
jgi:hypothetical protein